MTQSPARSLSDPRDLAPRLLAALLLLLVALAAAPAVALDEEPALLSPLEEWVRTPDPEYEWQVVSSEQGEGYTWYLVEMTSQKWLDEKIVDRPVWTHWLIVVRPDEVKSDIGMLYISGGDNDDERPDGPSQLLVDPALATGTVTVELRMVPNQPLTFAGDSYGPRQEDELIAYGWRQFLEQEKREPGSGDPEWLARLPMTKSAVRAMDTVRDFMGSGDGGEVSVQRWVVAGGSKRGWTTWTTAVADPRVVAIAPIVIDLLNVQPSFVHHYRAYGFYAPAVGDYEREGIMEWQGTAAYQRLLDYVDPFSYRHRLTLPKYVLNATGDQFFLPDSWQFYWNALPGEKHLRYVPNSEHSMGGTDVAVGFLAFYQSIVEGVERPRYDWTIEPGKDDDSRVLTFTPTSKERPTRVLLWRADNPESRDFRVDTIGRAWRPTELEMNDEGRYEVEVTAPEEGWAGYYLEATYPGPGQAPFKFSGGIQVLPTTLPFDAPSFGTESEETAAGGR